MKLIGTFLQCLVVNMPKNEENVILKKVDQSTVWCIGRLYCSVNSITVFKVKGKAVFEEGGILGA